MKKLLIGQVARKSGIPASTIRYYESVGVLPEAERVRGRRCYDEDVLLLLAAISTAKRAGFSVKEMRHFVRGFPDEVSPSARWSAVAHKKLAEFGETLRRIEGMRSVLQTGLQCRCLRLSECELVKSEK